MSVEEVWEPYRTFCQFLSANFPLYCMCCITLCLQNVSHASFFTSKLHYRYIRMVEVYKAVVTLLSEL